MEKNDEEEPGHGRHRLDAHGSSPVAVSLSLCLSLTGGNHPESRALFISVFFFFSEHFHRAKPCGGLGSLAPRTAAVEGDSPSRFFPPWLGSIFTEFVRGCLITGLVRSVVRDFTEFT